MIFFPIHSLEMLDKVEPPTIPEGFGISVAYACLLDIVRSISHAILGPSKVNNNLRNGSRFRKMSKIVFFSGE